MTIIEDPQTFQRVQINSNDPNEPHQTEPKEQIIREFGAAPGQNGGSVGHKRGLKLSGAFWQFQ